MTTLFSCLLTLALSAQHDGHGVSKGGHMGRHFENAEQWAKTFDDPKRDEWQLPDRVIGALGLKPGQSVADIGAGTGYFAVRLAKSAARPKVFAADIEPSMVAYLKKRAQREGLANLTAVQAKSDNANLPEPVELVLIVDTYHHIAGRSSYLRKLATSLKPEGRLAIIDFRKGAPTGPPDHFRFTEAELTHELSEAGFVLIDKHNFLPNQMFLVWKRKQ